MAAAIPIALAVTAAASAGTAAYSISQGEKQRKAAGKEAEKRDMEARRLEEELRQRQAAEESSANATRIRDAARQRQRGRATGGQSARDTLLTGPSGLGSDTGSGTKTLLGL